MFIALCVVTSGLWVCQASPEHVRCSVKPPFHPHLLEMRKKNKLVIGFGPFTARAVGHTARRGHSNGNSR